MTREIADFEQRVRDRRSAWTDPHFWVPIAIQALISFAAIVTIVTNTRSDIISVKEKIAELRGQVTTLQSLVTITTEQKGKLDAIEERLKKMENFRDTQEQAYNFNFTTRLAKVEARSGITSKKDGE